MYMDDSKRDWEKGTYSTLHTTDQLPNTKYQFQRTIMSYKIILLNVCACVA